MSIEITEEKYRKLKQEVEDTKAEADRAQGALDQLLTRLKDEFACSNLKEAKARLVELKAKKEQAETTFEKVMADYEEKWKESTAGITDSQHDYQRRNRPREL